MKKYNTFNLQRLEKRLENCSTISEIHTAILPLTKRKCPHYGVVKDAEGVHLVYAGVSDYMNLEQILDIEKLLIGYVQKSIFTEECSLTPKQLRFLALYGYGVVVYVEAEQGILGIDVLQREFDNGYANVAKRKIFESVDSKYRSAAAKASKEEQSCLQNT